MDSRVLGFLGTQHYDDTETLVLSPSPTGTTLYVDGTNGNDAYDGLSATWDGFHGPKKTISNALWAYNGWMYTKPVHVLIKAGTYGGFGIPAGYGWNPTSEGDRMIIGPYGDGEVIVSGSMGPFTWTAHDSNIYKTQTNSNAEFVVINGNFKSYREVGSLEAVNSFGKWWYNSGTGYFYIHTSGNNPTDDHVVITPDDPAGGAGSLVYFDSNNNYVTLYGLTIEGSQGTGVGFNTENTSTNNITLDRCIVRYSARTGYYGSYATYNIVNKCLFVGNVMRNWPRGNNGYQVGGGGWASTCNVGSNSVVRGSIMFDSGGEGFDGGGTDSIFEDNIAVDCFSVNFYLDYAINPIARRNISLCTAVDFNDIYDTNQVPPADEYYWKTIRKMRPQGIMTGDEYYALSTGAQIYNNLIIACRNGITHNAEQAPTSGVKNMKIYNNVIITPNQDPALSHDNFSGISYEWYNANHINSFVRNNILIGGHASTNLIRRGTDGGVTFDYNLYYHANNATPLKYNEVAYSFDNWKINTGYDANSINSDPLLNRLDWSVITNIVTNDFKPGLSSPARNVGYILGTPWNVDFNNNSRPTETNYTIGAFEYIQTIEKYAKEALSALPAADSDLTIEFSPLDYTYVDSIDGDFTLVTAPNKYGVFLMKDKNTSVVNIPVRWVGKTNIPGSQSTVFLQIYNRNSTTWETIANNNTCVASEIFTLYAEVTTNLSNYYDANYWVACRVYQQAI